MRANYTITYIDPSGLEEVYKRGITSQEEAILMAENYHHRKGYTVTVYDDHQKRVVQFEAEKLTPFTCPR